MTTISLTGTASTDAVEDAYQRLLAALVAEDAPALERLLADGCTIIGPKGFAIGKDEWVRTHSSTIYQQVELRSLETTVHRWGDTVVRSDLQHSECRFDGERVVGLYRVLSVWTHRSGGWALAAIQYTTVAPEARPDVVAAAG